MYAYLCGVVINNKDYEEMFLLPSLISTTVILNYIVFILFNFLSPVYYDFGT